MVARISLSGFLVDGLLEFGLGVVGSPVPRTLPTVPVVVYRGDFVSVRTAESPAILLRLDLQFRHDRRELLGDL